MMTEKIPENVSIEDLCEELRKSYDDVKIKGKNHIALNYSGTKINILKKKKGYHVSPDVPGYMFWLCFFAVVILFFCFNKVDFAAVNSDNWPSLIVAPAVSGLVFGGLLYLFVVSEVYAASKKKVVKEFCDSLKQL